MTKCSPFFRWHQFHLSSANIFGPKHCSCNKVAHEGCRIQDLWTSRRPARKQQILSQVSYCARTGVEPVLYPLSCILFYVCLNMSPELCMHLAREDPCGPLETEIQKATAISTLCIDQAMRGSLSLFHQRWLEQPFWDRPNTVTVEWSPLFVLCILYYVSCTMLPVSCYK